MDVHSVSEVIARLAPAQARLEAAWSQDLSDSAHGDRLMDAIADLNEQCDAVMPALARAFGEPLLDVRERFMPPSDCHAAFDGNPVSFLEQAIMQRSLDPAQWSHVAVSLSPEQTQGGASQHHRVHPVEQGMRL